MNSEVFTVNYKIVCSERFINREILRISQNSNRNVNFFMPPPPPVSTDHNLMLYPLQETIMKATMRTMEML